jgi:hypothetical protein
VSADPYRPANGTEGEDFQDRFCRQCINDREFRETCTGGCDILFRALLYGPEDAGYPTEWQFGWDGKPTCTAFLPEGEAA